MVRWIGRNLLSLLILAGVAAAFFLIVRGESGRAVLTPTPAAPTASAREHSCTLCFASAPFPARSEEDRAKCGTQWQDMLLEHPYTVTQQCQERDGVTYVSLIICPVCPPGAKTCK